MVVVVDGYEFGLAKLGPCGDKMYPSSRVISIGGKKLAKLMIHATCLIKCLVEIYFHQEWSLSTQEIDKINDARNLFVEIPRRNLVSWNNMIFGTCIMGKVAYKLFVVGYNALQGLIFILHGLLLLLFWDAWNGLVYGGEEEDENEFRLIC